MELMFEIEETMLEAEILNSLLRAVTNTAYDGSYEAGYFETAFNHICNLAHDHSKHLEKLTDEAFALKKAGKVKCM
ncbi:MAG: hypothetical protein K1W06_07390 [Lachnospiraceae bacterium]